MLVVLAHLLTRPLLPTHFMRPSSPQLCRGLDGGVPPVHAADGTVGSDSAGGFNTDPTVGLQSEIGFRQRPRAGANFITFAFISQVILVV